LEEESPSLMIVDRNLPNCEGSEFVDKLRGYGYNIPVIFLSAKSKDEEIYQGFKRGGDDYITKPYKIKDILFRIEAILKRVGVKKENKMKYRDLLLDIDERALYVDGFYVELTNIEFNILYLFMKNNNQTLDRDFIRDEVWKDSSSFNQKTINVAINRLKKKIDPKGEKSYFLPVWGVGYRLI